MAILDANSTIFEKLQKNITRSISQPSEYSTAGSLCNFSKPTFPPQPPIPTFIPTYLFSSHSTNPSVDAAKNPLLGTSSKQCKKMAIRNARSSAKKKIVRFNIAPQYYYFDRRDEPKSLLSSQSVYRQKIKYEAELKKAYSTTCSKTSNAEADLPGSSQILQEKRNVISRCTSLICQDVYDSVVARQRLLGNNMLGDRGRIRFKVYFLHPSFENACEKCAKWQLLRFGIRCYIDKPDNITEQMTQTVDLHYQDFFICYSCNRYTL